VNYEGTWPGGTRVRFRTLTWREFQYFQRLAVPKGVRNLEVYKTCLISGPPPDQVPAGVVSWIGCEQIEESPFSGKFKLVQQYLQLGRGWLGGSYLNQAQALVAGTFHYTIEQVEQMDPEIFFKRLAAAELLVGKQLEPADPSKSEKELKEDEFERANRLRKEARQQQRSHMQRKIADRRERWGNQ
jgi:hypothetical protein